jgi:diguanylate cyclase (GGDEF)-like protein/PAS domain S-box-containing protein
VRKAPNPLRETNVLHRYTQAGVYGILFAFLPIQIWLIGMPLEYALASDAYFLGLATLAIEGAFKNGRLIRKRVAYPTSILAEMRESGSLAEAARLAARRTAELLRVSVAVIQIGDADERPLFTDSRKSAEDLELVKSFRPTIQAARESGEVVRARYREGEVVVVPLLGAHGEIGALIIYADRHSDASDLQVLQNIGSRVGIFLEAHWQREILVKEEAHIKAVLDAIPDVIMRIMADGTITYYVSRHDMDGRMITVDNPVGHNVYDFLPESLVRTIREAIRNAIVRGELQRLEYANSTFAGMVYREVRIVPVADDEILAIVRDITETRAAEVALREREEYFRQLIENAHDAIVVVSMEGTVKYASPALGRLLGYSPEELVGVDALELVEPEDREILIEKFAAQFQGGVGKSDAAEFRARHKDGSIRIIEAAARPLNPDSVETEIVVNGRDVTERQEAAAILRESEERMRTIFEEAPIGMAVVRPQDYQVLSVNKALCEMLGYSQDELKEKGILALMHPDDVEQDVALAQQLIAAEINSYRLEKRFIRPDGEITWGELTATVIRNEQGEALYGLGMIENVTDRKKAEETVRHLAFHDHLTALPNRALFRDRLELAIAQARRGQQIAAVLFLDLGRFKIVNDSVGHAEGDQLLCRVAEKLSVIVRDGDTVARVGGDEFTVLLPTIDKVQDAVRIANRILDGLSEPFLQAGKEFVVSGSVGITIIPDDGDDVDTLLRNADIAMYRAKEQGRNQYQLYAPQMNQEIVERITFESDLRHAVERGELELHYQPQFDVKTMQLTGVEALCRWKRDGEYVPPTVFIPIAEETGLITALGSWVLREACTQVLDWRNTGLPTVRVSVNVSAREFQSADIVERVRSVLTETGLDPSCLQIEITEGVAMEAAEATIETLHRLKAMGVQLALDDFGIGYSSLAYLKRFPIDILKIDCSFVQNVGVTTTDTALVGAIITMAHSMGIRVIAEGVEKPDQLAFLREPQIEGGVGIACDEFQGFLASGPAPAIKVEELLRSGKHAHEPTPAN